MERGGWRGMERDEWRGVSGEGSRDSITGKE